MFLRVSRVKRKNKSYAYAQLVESFRRDEDGLPAHRIVANLGQLSQLEIDNFRLALNASKDKKKVVVSRLVKSNNIKLSKPQNNLVYLDLAVLFEIWNQSGIGAILRDSFPPNSTKIPIDTTIAILCLHRCQDPGSKLSATRWYKTTALPEITGVDATTFNNSRLHRSMYELEQIGATLMAKLSKFYGENDDRSSVLFLDVSDAWFFGAGPSYAQKGLSKDGAIRTKVGIVLLCNKEGLPLRWDVVAGASQDSTIMIEMLDDIKSLPWVRGVPLVCDRAMGRSSLFQKMYKMNIIFLTALSRHEFSNYASSLLDSPIEIKCEGLSVDEATKKVRSFIEERKDLVKVQDDLFTIDLGRTEVTVLSERSDLMRHKKYAGNRIRTAMDLGRRIKIMIEDGLHGSIVSAGKSLGLKSSLSYKYHNLTKLPEQVQQAILDGEADNCSINVIDEIATNIEPQDMFDKFYHHVQECRRKPVNPKREYNQINEKFFKPSKTESEDNFDVRVVAYFNPQMYVSQRKGADRLLKQIQAFQDDLNRRISASNCRRNKNSIYAEVDRILRKKDIIRCFDIDIREEHHKNQKRQKVSIKLREKEWKIRRAYDGFCVLIAHPDCSLSHEELCKLYRAKDVVEKDFQTIKSVLQVRPIRHRSDEKVKAHVSICMLSLLLERLFKKRLGGTSSVRKALDILHTCHLNRFVADEKSLYTITETDTDQRRILKKLGMSYLADDDHLLERISVR